MWNEDSVFLKPKNFNRDKVRFPVYVEAKHDGHRVAVTRDGRGALGVFTPHRECGILLPINLLEGRAIVLPPWVHKLPAGSIVECELVWPGHPASDVVTAMKDCPSELDWRPFAIPFINKQDYRSMCYLAMRDLIQRRTRYEVPVMLMDAYHSEISLLQQAEALGLEGYVLKERGYSGWWKLKLEWTLDLEVLGFQAGKGKYEGHVGALLLRDSKGVEIRCSGMTEAVRFALTHRDVGRIVEVEHSGLTVNGKLRHPRFKRWRDDKVVPDEIGKKV